jgi:hypothetical protein
MGRLIFEEAKEDLLMFLFNTLGLAPSSASLSLLPAYVEFLDPFLDIEKLLGGAVPRTVFRLMLCMYELLRDCKDMLGDGDRMAGKDTVLPLAMAPRVEAGVRRRRNLA